MVLAKVWIAFLMHDQQRVKICSTVHNDFNINYLINRQNQLQLEYYLSNALAGRPF